MRITKGVFSSISYSVIGLLVLWLSSCSKTEETPLPPMGYDYFPVNIGHSVIYDFDSIFVDTKVSANETLHFQVKEYIESVFKDNAGRLSQRVERYVRSSDTASWKIKNVCYVTRTRSEAERVEDNQRIIKLIFPVKENKKWLGNSYTTTPEWEFEYSETDKEQKVNGITFDSTLTVMHVDEENLIKKNYVVEQYAKHVGLIYKENVLIETTPARVITKAIISKYKIKSFVP